MSAYGRTAELKQRFFLALFLLVRVFVHAPPLRLLWHYEFVSLMEGCMKKSRAGALGFGSDFHFRAAGDRCLGSGWLQDAAGVRALRLHDVLRDARAADANFCFPCRGEFTILLGFVDWSCHEAEIVLPLLVVADTHLIGTFAVIVVDLAKDATRAAFDIEHADIDFVVPSGAFPVHECRSARCSFLECRSLHDFVSC